MRHGQTDWNADHRVQGHTDIALNEVGATQAKTLRSVLKGIEFDAVYTSPLRRAKDTAELIVCDRYEIIMDDRLMERCFGEYEGMQAGFWTELDFDIDDINLQEFPGGIESIGSIFARVRDFLDFVVSKHDADANILVVGHGALFKAFDWILSEHEPDALYGDRRISNAEVREYEI